MKSNKIKTIREIFEITRCALKYVSLVSRLKYFKDVYRDLGIIQGQEP